MTEGPTVPSSARSASGRRPVISGAITPMIRCRSSTEPNSTTIRPLARPIWILTLVSNMSDSRVPSSSTPGALILRARRLAVGSLGGRHGDRLLGGAHAHALGHDAGRQGVLGVGVRQARAARGRARRR